ncbi:hypothetical protein A4S06_09255 [Erysipelotrichaceae bacterium MTC7]|nr:hypothetical protein A4S06_09255 [Erysipelotrichaceae bacterium MTC7]
MKRKLLPLLLLVIALISGCTNTIDKKTSDKPVVVASSFIGYDLVSNIAKDLVDVSNMTPWGSELHNFEPTTKDMVNIEEADLFVFLSEELETWTSSSANKSQSLNLSKMYTLAKHDHEHETENESEHDHEGHDHASLHFWTDPTTYIQLIDAVCDRLVQLDSTHKDTYETNAAAYKQEILGLHEDFEQYMDSQTNPTIFFAGHNAMDAFADRYHLDIVSLNEEYTPDADLTAKQLETLTSEIVKHEAKTVFTEELVEPRVANLIKDNLQQEDYTVNILELHGYHNIAKEQAKKGVRYVDLFKQNIENIKQALGD